MCGEKLGGKQMQLSELTELAQKFGGLNFAVVNGRIEIDGKPVDATIAQLIIEGKIQGDAVRAVLGVNTANPKKAADAVDDTDTGSFTNPWSTHEKFNAGNNVLCPRSNPSTKRFIRSPANRQESYRANHQQQSVFTQPGSGAYRMSRDHLLLVRLDRKHRGRMVDPISGCDTPGRRATPPDLHDLHRPSFGGRRWWFICPVTAKRVGKLYVPNGATHFAGRKAHDLTYT
jgi:hypothetical protein